MKSIITYSIMTLLLLLSNNVWSQVVQAKDTLINRGNYEINFSIIKGTGVPILFESGASNDGTVWEPILNQIHEITGATLITYDRAGFGKSTLDTINKDLGNHGIMAGILDLEAGLRQLGYDEDIMLISHSYGGYFNYLYASRHPEKVKAIVAIDIVHDYHAEGFAEKLVNRMQDNIEKWEHSNQGMYYLLSTLTEAASIIPELKMPSEIPVVDIIMSSDFGINKEEAERWVECHKKFVESHPNATGIYAENTDHYIWKYNPSLIINTIVKSYTENTGREDALEIYQRALNYAIEASNLSRKILYSEDEINSWGYSALENGNIPKALKIFELNTELYPESFNVYDSYGEVLLKANRKKEALEMYQKSVELNPENENGIIMINQLLK